MGKGSDGGPKGFAYTMSLHFGLSRGPLNELVEIRVAEETAWTGSITDDADNREINKPELFGGKQKEGGITGRFALLMGKAAQTLAGRGAADAPMAASYGAAGLSPLTGFRGVATLWWRGVVAVNNPYPKPWRMRVRRSNAGWDGDDPWYPARARIIVDGGGGAMVHGMNPAHILYECITNRAWGRGLPREIMDEDAWVSAANVLCDEGFALCMRWNREDDLDQFMQGVINHIGGSIFVDRGSGLLTIRLMRGGYDPAALPLFTPESGLLAVEADDNGSDSGGFNEIVVKWRSPIDNEDRRTRAHNLAARESAGGTISTSVDYPGIPYPELAGRVALRDLKMQGPGLRRWRLKVDRRGWKLAPGSLLRISYPPRGIGDMALRVAKTDEAEHTDGTITVQAVTDVFALPDAGLQSYQEPAWTPPDRAAYPVAAQALAEATYRQVYRALSAADLAALDPDSGAIVALAVRPTRISMNYALLTRPEGGAYAERGNGSWTPSALLAADAGAAATALTLSAATGLAAVAAGQAAMLGGEWVRVDAVDADAGTLAVARGVLDTVPAPHAAGTRLWFPDAGSGRDGQEYASGEVVEAKLLTQTSSARLAEADAPEMALEVAARHARPYPPGQATIGGVPFAAAAGTTVFGDLALAWAHRNRAVQADTLLAHAAAAGLSAEAGTTYRVRVLSGATVLRDVAGIGGTAWTYTEAMAAADGNATALTLELWSERDGRQSWQRLSGAVTHLTAGSTGFDQAFGYDFGGTP